MGRLRCVGIKVPAVDERLIRDNDLAYSGKQHYELFEMLKNLQAMASRAGRRSCRVVSPESEKVDVE